MKIAQVAPLIESVPPRLYGGTERINASEAQDDNGRCLGSTHIGS
jgi:hypothetical protein